jgi:hypothetical protein
MVAMASPNGFNSRWATDLEYDVQKRREDQEEFLQTAQQQGIRLKNRVRTVKISES